MVLIASRCRLSRSSANFRLQLSQGVGGGSGGDGVGGGSGGEGVGGYGFDWHIMMTVVLQPLHKPWEVLRERAILAWGP